MGASQIGELPKTMTCCLQLPDGENSEGVRGTARPGHGAARDLLAKFPGHRYLESQVAQHNRPRGPLFVDSSSHVFSASLFHWQNGMPFGRQTYQAGLNNFRPLAFKVEPCKLGRCMGMT